MHFVFVFRRVYHWIYIAIIVMLRAIWISIVFNSLLRACGWRTGHSRARLCILCKTWWRYIMIIQIYIFLFSFIHWQCGHDLVRYSSIGIMKPLGNFNSNLIDVIQSDSDEILPSVFLDWHEQVRDIWTRDVGTIIMRRIIIWIILQTRQKNDMKTRKELVWKDGICMAMIPPRTMAMIPMYTYSYNA